MSIKTELNNLKNVDVYSLMLFTLYQCIQSDEYSALSELAYIWDEKNLLSLCEYFGGTTITIPKIEDLELLLCGLSIYKSVQIDGMNVDEVLIQYNHHKFDLNSIKESYCNILNVMNKFSFGGRDELQS